MASSGTFVNPHSRTLVHKGPTALSKDKTSESIFLGEVVSVVYTGEKAGVISYRSGQATANVSLENVTNLAQPLLANIKIYPLVGEAVLIFNFGLTYYLPVNLLNNPNVNQISGTMFSKTLANQKVDASKLVPSTFNLKNKKIYITPSYEGDVVIEGRFGQSLKFGSTIKSKNTPVTGYSRSDLSEAGDPIIIIRNGSKNAEENILLDDASIYLCSSQKIFVDNSENGFEGVVGEWSTININSVAYQVEDNSETKLTAEEKQIALEQLSRATTSANKNIEDPGTTAARDQVLYLNNQITTGQAAGASVTGSTDPLIPVTVTGLRKKIVAYAQQDASIPVVETPYASNYSDRINVMVANCGLDNIKKYNRDKEGYYWCAAAVTSWYKSAGADIPPGPAGCDSWKNWAIKRNTFSSTPVTGAAILFGTTSNAHHIGIVESSKDGFVYTIEGNTSGAKFDRNGTGCYRKKYSLKSNLIVGYVIPTKGGKIEE